MLQVFHGRLKYTDVLHLSFDFSCTMSTVILRNMPTMIQRNCLTFKCYDLAGGIHDGAVGRDGPADGCVGVCQVNDHHLSLLAHLLTDTNKLVRLHG